MVPPIGLRGISVLPTWSPIGEPPHGGSEGDHLQRTLSLEFMETEWSLDYPAEVTEDPHLLFFM